MHPSIVHTKDFVLTRASIRKASTPQLYAQRPQPLNWTHKCLNPSIAHTTVCTRSSTPQLHCTNDSIHTLSRPQPLNCMHKDLDPSIVCTKTSTPQLYAQRPRPLNCMHKDLDPSIVCTNISTPQLYAGVVLLHKMVWGCGWRKQ